MPRKYCGAPHTNSDIELTCTREPDHLGAHTATDDHDESHAWADPSPDLDSSG